MSAAIQPIAGVAGFAPIGPIPHIRPHPRAPAIEVGAYSIMEFNRNGMFKADPYQALCDTRAIAEGFADAMQRRGHKTPVRRREEQVSPKQWHTPTDRDRYGIDTVDMAFISTHGGTYGVDPTLPHEWVKSWLDKPAQFGKTKSLDPLWYAMFCDSPDGTDITSLVMDPNTFIPPDLKKPVANMRLGGGKLRWLVLDACRSLQIGGQNERDDVARAQLAKADPGRTWAPCYAGVQMLFGYTGYITHQYSVPRSTPAWSCSGSSTVEKKGERFGRRAGRGDLLSESWLDEAFSSRDHNIPVVTVFAPSVADLDWRLKSQSLRKPGPASKKPIRSFVYSSMWRSS